MVKPYENNMQHREFVFGFFKVFSSWNGLLHVVATQNSFQLSTRANHQLFMTMNFPCTFALLSCKWLHCILECVGHEKSKKVRQKMLNQNGRTFVVQTTFGSLAQFPDAEKCKYNNKPTTCFKHNKMAVYVTIWLICVMKRLKRSRVPSGTRQIQSFLWKLRFNSGFFRKSEK